MVTDSCVESYDGWPRNGKAIKLRGTKDCDGSRDRTKLHFLETGTSFKLSLFIEHCIAYNLLQNIAAICCKKEPKLRIILSCF